MECLIHTTITYSLPLIIVALAGVFAERSGIVNLALEGTMILGAYAGVGFIRLHEATPWISGALSSMNYLTFQELEVITFVFCGLVGAVFCVLLAAASIHLGANQTVVGTALNMMAPAFVLFLCMELYNRDMVSLRNLDTASMFLLKKSTFGIDKDANLGIIGNLLLHKTTLASYLCIGLIPVLSFVLYRTRFGLRLRACGENPEAAASLGVNVQKMRWAGTLISGALAGVGGFVYALTTAGCTANGDVAGFGFLALSVMIFGNWKPIPIVIAGLVFGFCKCISVSYFTLDLNGDGIYALASSGISAHFYRMIPYVITLIVLAFTSKKSRAPKAEGIPYELTKD